MLKILEDRHGLIPNQCASGTAKTGIVVRGKTNQVLRLLLNRADTDFFSNV